MTPAGGFEEQCLRYERERRRTSSSDHLPPTQVYVLRKVVEHGTLAESELVSAELSRSSLSRAVSKLAKACLLTRKVDRHDGRRHILYSTKLSRDMLARLDRAAAAPANPPPPPTEEVNSLPPNQQQEFSTPASPIRPLTMTTTTQSRYRTPGGRSVAIGIGQLYLMPEQPDAGSVCQVSETVAAPVAAGQCGESTSVTLDTSPDLKASVTAK